MKKVVIMVSAMALAYSAFAANVVGKYNGKLNIDLSAIKKMVQEKAAKGDANAKQQAEQALKMIDQQGKMIASSVIKLELKKDGTLTLVQTVNGKTENETGKWTAKGNSITISNLTGKNGGPKSLTGTISKDGKTLFFDLSDEMKKQAAKRAGQPAPKGSLTFKRA